MDASHCKQGCVITPVRGPLPATGWRGSNPEPSTIQGLEVWGDVLMNQRNM